MSTKTTGSTTGWPAQGAATDEAVQAGMAAREEENELDIKGNIPGATAPDPEG